MASYPALELRFAPGPGAGALQDQLYGELDAFEPLAIHEHDTGNGWLVFFRHASHRDAARHALASTFGRNVLDVRPVDVEDDDWARRSQASLTAIRIGRIVVAPPWDAPTFKSQAPGPNDHGSNPASGAEDSTLLIVIEPSTGFGTGHHATTRLCLALLQQMDLVGRTVIDIGTGSGVLAIAARLLGAAAVTAVDNDPDALANARENIARNPDAGAIGVMEAELAFLSAPPADVVTANLTGAVLRKYASTLTALVRPGGTLIASGFGDRELPDVVAALGGQADRELREEDWCAVVIRRAPATED